MTLASILLSALLAVACDPTPPTPLVVLSPAEELDLQNEIAVALGGPQNPNSISALWHKLAPVVKNYRDPNGGLVYPYLTGERPPTKCSSTADDAANNAVYCPTDESISYDLNLVRYLYRKVGRMAPSALLAHEWGHHIQRLIGGGGISKRDELQADCYAGVYLGYRYYTMKTMVFSDVQGTALAFFVIGDDNLGGQPVHWYDPGVHGNSAERRMAWGIGFDTSDFAYCLAYSAFANLSASRIAEGQFLVAPPATTATVKDAVLTFKGFDAQADIYTLSVPSSNDPAAQLRDIVAQFRLNTLSGYVAGEVRAGWLDVARLGTGSGAWMTYSWKAGNTQFVGMLLVQTRPSTKTSMVWNVYGVSLQVVQEFEQALIWGYCENGAPVFQCAAATN